MVEINQRLLMVISALAIVCIVSIVGSFIAWVIESIDYRGDYNKKSQIHRWKWMVVAFFVIVAFMLMGAK